MLSLIELQNKKVEAKRKKYEKDEMDEYLDLVFENYKELLEANKKLETEKIDLNKKMKTLSDGVQYYRSIETTLQKALILAEKTSKETKDAAILKAEAIEREAQNRAKTIVKRAEDHYQQICEKSERLVQQFEQYKSKLKEATQAQLQLIDSEKFDIDEPVAETLKPDFEPEEVLTEDTTLDEIQNEDSKEEMTSSEETSAANETLQTSESTDIDTSKEELLNADTIDLRNTFDAVKTETEESTSEKPAVTPSVAAVKDANIVEPIEAKTVDAATLSLDTLTDSSESASSAEVSLEEVLTEKKEASQATSSGIPTLDSLLQDLNMNNKGSQNSDDPFEFLGSIDDDF